MPRGRKLKEEKQKAEEKEGKWPVLDGEGEGVCVSTRKLVKIENSGNKCLSDLEDGGEVRCLGDPGYTMRESKLGSPTDH